MRLARPALLSCRACGFRGSPPSDVVARAEASFAALASSDARARQLRGSQARALVSAGTIASAFVAVLTLAVVPVLILAIYGVHEIAAYEGEVGHILVICIVPSVATMGVSALMLGRLLSRRRALESACSAVAPIEPGAPTTCHVCGGDLPTVGARAVVRCTYCAADNLVDPRIVVTASARRHVALAAQAEDVEAELSRFRRASAGLGFGTVVLAIVVPPLTLVALFLTLLPMLALSGSEVDASARYVVMARKDGDCVGYVRRRRSGGFRVDYLRHGAGESPYVEVDALPPTRDAKSFVGLRLRRPSGQVAVVADVKGSPITHNVAVFDPKRPDGTDSLHELCLAP